MKLNIKKLALAGMMTALWEKREAARLALQKAGEKKKPVVLDAVGCGASAFRQETIQELLQIPWKGIIKGNQSEIYSIQQKVLTLEGIDAYKERELGQQRLA